MEELDAITHRLQAVLDGLGGSDAYADDVGVAAAEVSSISVSIVEVQSAIADALVVLDALPGECRIDTPFASVQPVIDRDGLRWCCTHATTHCA